MANQLSLSEQVLNLIQAQTRPISFKAILFRLSAYNKRKGVESSLERLVSEGKIICKLKSEASQIHFFLSRDEQDDDKVYQAVSSVDIDADFQSLIELEPFNNVIFVSLDGTVFTKRESFNPRSPRCEVN